MNEERRAEQTRAAFADALAAAQSEAAQRAPRLGAPGEAEVERLRCALGALAAVTEAGLALLDETVRDRSAERIARVYARCAAIAIAARDRITADSWLEEAARLARCEELLREMAAARAEPERYRQLALGRHLQARGNERGARKLWEAMLEGDAPAASAPRNGPRARSEPGAPTNHDEHSGRATPRRDPGSGHATPRRDPGSGHATPRRDPGSGHATPRRTPPPHREPTPSRVRLQSDVLARLAAAELALSPPELSGWPAWQMVRMTRLALLALSLMVILGFIVHSCLDEEVPQPRAQPARPLLLDDERTALQH